VAGLDPRLFTVAELWLVAEAKRRHDRQHAVNQASLVWTDFEKVDAERFIRFGEMKPPLTIDDVMSPTLRAQVEEEERKLRNGKPQ
jgi:hypothetical protein